MSEPHDVFCAALERADSRARLSEHNFARVADAISDAGHEIIGVLRNQRGWSTRDSHALASRMVDATVDWVVGEDRSPALLRVRLAGIWRAEPPRGARRC